jgi:hypothetical protein
VSGLGLEFDQISATKDGAGKVAQLCPILGCSPVVRDFIGQHLSRIQKFSTTRVSLANG